ncbi:MAG: DUF222 domain-containing protein [Acidimicrobiales bacterium]
MVLGGSEENRAGGDAFSETLDVAAIADEHLAKFVLEAELANRRQHAEYLELLAEANRRGCAKDPIHRNTSTWMADELRARTRSSTKTLHLARLAFEHHPEIGRRYRNGELNLDHLGLFTHIWHRRELRDALARDLEHLLRWTTKSWNECANLFRAWEELVDPIDPNDEAQKAHSRRGFATSRLGHDLLGEFKTTTAFWAVVEAGLQAKVDELFEADWAEARARVGDDACGEDLLRSNSQRWHDAVIILLRHGIGADPSTANVVANVVADDQTLIDEAERRDADLAGRPAPVRHTDDAVERAAHHRCETASGMPLAPADVLDFAIAGHLRLFRTTTETHDFTASAKVRLFKGAKRLGILLRDRHCQGAGCNTHSVHCEVDHTIRYTDGGLTVPTNGKSRCGPCHRHKTRLETLGLWPPD